VTRTEIMQRAGAWLARVRRSPAVETAVRTLTAAAVTGTADPPGPRPRWVRRTPRWLPFPLDLAVAVDLILALIILGTTTDQLQQSTPSPGTDNLATLAALFVSAPLVLRTWWPLAAWRCSLLAVVWAALTLRGVEPAKAVGAGIVLALCLYAVAVRAERRVTMGAWLITVACVVLLSRDQAAGVTGALMVSIPVLFGHNVRIRRQAQQHLVEQERQLEESQQARTLLEERSRIARELHDVVAHHMSVIAIQAEAAPYKVPNPPPELATSFAEIRASALEGLTELRRILGVLRSEQGSADTVPQPGLDRLGDLVVSAQNAGLTVRTSVTGAARPLPPGVEVSAYRIVQEALSNAMRYAPGARVTIDVAYGAHALGLRIVNGPPRGNATAGPDGSGHGLLGMHERASMLGGELTARATPDGGFAIVVTLPLNSEDAA